MTNSDKARIAVTTVLIILIVIGVGFSVAYHVWTARGDQVQFSAIPNLGLGAKPLTVVDSKGKTVQYATSYNFLFVRDVAMNREVMKQFRQPGT